MSLLDRYRRYQRSDERITAQIWQIDHDMRIETNRLLLSPNRKRFSSRAATCRDRMIRLPTDDEEWELVRGYWLIWIDFVVEHDEPSELDLLERRSRRKAFTTAFLDLCDRRAIAMPRHEGQWEEDARLASIGLPPGH